MIKRIILILLICSACQAAIVYDRDILGVDERVYYRSALDYAVPSGTADKDVLQWNLSTNVWDNIAFSTFVGTIDHGLLLGLTDDDHTQYILATGARIGASSQIQEFTNGIKFNSETETAGAWISYKTAAVTPTFSGIFEVVDTVAVPISTDFGLLVALCPDPDSTDSLRGGGFFGLTPTGALTNANAPLGFKQIVGLFGGVTGAITNLDDTASTNNLDLPDLFGLQFSVSNDADLTGKTGAGSRTSERFGALVVSNFGAAGRTVGGASNRRADIQNIAGKFIAPLLGTYNAEEDRTRGTNIAVHAIVTDSITMTNGDIDSYGLLVDVPASKSASGNGGLISWNAYFVNDVPSFLKGDWYFGQTDGAERITSDADGTLDFYAGTKTVVHSVLEVDAVTGTAIETLTSDTTLDSTHSTVVVATSGSDITITLPTAASAYNSADEVGWIYNITTHYDNVQNVIIEGNGSETIDGDLNITAPAREIWTPQSNGTEWFLVY